MHHEKNKNKKAYNLKVFILNLHVTASQDNASRFTIVNKIIQNIPAIQYNVIRNHHRIQGIGSRGVQAGWLLIGNNR
jgi:hypothetical protein